MRHIQIVDDTHISKRIVDLFHMVYLREKTEDTVNVERSKVMELEMVF